MEFLDRLVERVSRFTLLIGGILIAFMAIVTTFGVIMRYVFRNPEHYTIELGIMFMV